MDPRKQLHAKRLQESLDQIPDLKARNVAVGMPDYKTWSGRIVQGLLEVFSEKSSYYKRANDLLLLKAPRSISIGFEVSKVMASAYAEIQSILKDALEELEVGDSQSEMEIDNGGLAIMRSQEAYDVAQVCVNGHVVNSSSKRFPHHNQDFCSACGKRTITECQDCGKPIRGAYVESFGEFDRPNFCHGCGKPYPWTAEKLEAAKAYADEVEGLSTEERETLKRSFDDLIVESPRTQLAAMRFKKLLPKIGQQVGSAFRDLLVDIASETAKKVLWPTT